MPIRIFKTIEELDDIIPCPKCRELNDLSVQKELDFCWKCKSKLVPVRPEQNKIGRDVDVYKLSFQKSGSNQAGSIRATPVVSIERAAQFARINYYRPNDTTPEIILLVSGAQPMTSLEAKKNACTMLYSQIHKVDATYNPW